MAASRRRVLVAGLVAALPLAVACQAVLNLDKYQKVDGGQDAGPDELLTSEAAGQDVTLPDVYSAPIDWAITPMPNPPFDAGRSADAQFNTLNAYDLVDGAVSDPIFKRVWSPDAAPLGSFDAAKAYCESLTIGGKKGRLPTRIELVSLIDFVKDSTLPTVFDGGKTRRMWTSSLVRPFAGTIQYWIVDFDGRTVRASDANTDYAALCTQAQ